MNPLQVVLQISEAVSADLCYQFLIGIFALFLVLVSEIGKMKRQHGQDSTLLERSLRFLNHHETVKSVIRLSLSVEHIRIDDKIKGIVFKIMTVVFPSRGRLNAAYLLILCLLVYVIQALAVNVHSIDFALLIKSISSRKRVISRSAAVIQDHRIRRADDRRKDLCAFCFLPVVYFIKNGHCPAAPVIHAIEIIITFNIPSHYYLIFVL